MVSPALTAYGFLLPPQHLQRQLRAETPGQTPCCLLHTPLHSTVIIIRLWSISHFHLPFSRQTIFSREIASDTLPAHNSSYIGPHWPNLGQGDVNYTSLCQLIPLHPKRMTHPQWSGSACPHSSLTSSTSQHPAAMGELHRTISVRRNMLLSYLPHG